MRLATSFSGRVLGLSKSVTSVEPGDIVSLADVKQFCRVRTDDDDGLLLSLIGASEAYVERYTGVTLRTTNITYEYLRYGIVIVIM